MELSSLITNSEIREKIQSLDADVTRLIDGPLGEDYSTKDAQSSAAADDALMNAFGLLHYDLVLRNAKEAFAEQPVSRLHREILEKLGEIICYAGYIHGLPLADSVPEQYRKSF